MMKHNHSTEQVALELSLKLLCCVTSGIHRDIAQGYAAGLIDFFQTINQRPALYRNSPSVIGDARIRFNHLGLDLDA